MGIIRWLMRRLRKKVEPLDLKYHMDDIVIAYDDVDLVVFSRISKNKK